MVTTGDALRRLLLALHDRAVHAQSHPSISTFDVLIPRFELPSLPAAKSLSNANGQLEDGIAKIAATLGGEHRSAAE